MSGPARFFHGLGLVIQHGTDQIIAGENRTNPLTMLRLITAPAADVVIQEAMPESLSTAIDWQHEFESTRAKRDKRKDLEATVDLLFAIDWQ